MTHQPENELNIGAEIQRIRLKSGLGSLVDAAEKLGFNKNTISSYEKGLTLPDIDFLVVFADKTGTDLNELLRLRLAASRYETVRELQGRFVPKQSAALLGNVLNRAISYSGLPMEEVISALGIDEHRLALLLNGAVLPDEAFLAHVANVTGYALEYLEDAYAISKHSVTFVEKEQAGQNPFKAPALMPSDTEYASIPLYDVRAAAGNGAVVEQEKVVDVLHFKQEWIRQELRASPDDLYLIYVDGESMEPTLRPGDVILVDHRDQSQARDGIYVLRMDGTLLVKRLQKLPGSVISVTSDNPAYKPFTVNLADLKGGDFAIIGRVVWSGRRM